MGVIFKKTEELKHLLIDKSLIEQKKIIVNFFYENRKLNKHFNMFYKAIKNIFENSSLSDYYAQDFIDKTFINRTLMFYYSTFNEFHGGSDWDIDEEDFETYTLIKTKELVDKMIWDNEILDNLEKKKKRINILKIIILSTGIVIFVIMSLLTIN